MLQILLPQINNVLQQDDISMLSKGLENFDILLDLREQVLALIGEDNIFLFLII